MRSAITLLLGLSLGVGGYYAWTHYYGQNLNYIDRELPKFDPDGMISFHWKSKDKSFSFQRKNQNAAWGPIVDEKRLSDRLHMLAEMSKQQLPYGKLNEIEDSAMVSISIGENSGQVWQGVWNGQWFVWIEGPLTGYGRWLENDLQLQRLFYEGQWAFTERAFDWCFARKILSIQGAIGSTDLSLKFNGQAWQKNFLSSNPVEVISENVNLWAEKNCKINVEYYHDYSLKELGGKVLGLINVTFAPEGSLQLLTLEEGLFAVKTHGSGNIYFYSLALSQALSELSNL